MARQKSYQTIAEPRRGLPEWARPPDARQVTRMSTDDIEVSMPWIKVGKQTVTVAYRQDKQWHQIEVDKKRIKEVA